MTDQEFLVEWRKRPRAELFHPLLDRYGGMVFASALQETPEASHAQEVTKAVFLALARRAKKLPKKSALEKWLSQMVCFTITKPRRFAWLRRSPKAAPFSAETVGPLSASLTREILEAIEAQKGTKPELPLARLALRRLAFQRWRRRVVIGGPAIVVLLGTVVGILWKWDARTGHSRSIAEYIIWNARREAAKVAEKAKPWPTDPEARMLKAAVIRNASDLYVSTNIWTVHLKFTAGEWKALEARRLEPLPHFLMENGLILLRNPKAPRSGLAGVLGYAFDWSQGNVEFGGMSFTNVAIRVKGNFGSLVGEKPSFKMDLNKLTRGQKLAGLDELTFNNLSWDYSLMSDSIGYEIFREAGVPAPRTAYAWLTVSVEGRWENRPLGIYLMVEPVDKAFMQERFGNKDMPVFKPVTYELFNDLGDDWSAYAPIYDLKTEATEGERRRLIELARLVTSATDAEFQTQIVDLVDLDLFARFLACEVLLANYDSILTTGQNFYLCLDMRSNKFVFVPWDLDAAWGNLWIGTKEEQERGSIWHPWVGENRFLERLMAAEAFRKLYRDRLEEFLSGIFQPERLQRRVETLAAFLRGPIGAESGFRSNKFEQEVAAKPVTPSPGETRDGINRPAYPVKKFVENRVKSVREQLDGKSEGLILKPPALR